VLRAWAVAATGWVAGIVEANSSVKAPAGFAVVPTKSTPVASGGTVTAREGGEKV